LSFPESVKFVVCSCCCNVVFSSCLGDVDVVVAGVIVVTSDVVDIANNTLVVVFVNIVVLTSKFIEHFDEVKK